MENLKRKAYVKPEAELMLIAIGENIASSGNTPPAVDSPFDGEEDFFEWYAMTKSLANAANIFWKKQSRAYPPGFVVV